MESYLSQVAALGTTFITLIAEALGLPPDGLSRFYDTPDRMQHRGKVVQYPVPSERSESDQGVGPHYDAGFLTIVSPSIKFNARNRPSPSTASASLAASRITGSESLRRLD